ncbi:chemokine (C-X-C motif) ligand 18a, duplicate 1 [Xyrauchen texanus]|uniref:chemokine (C-X-C motif) ligand 18a, duplicate 1 n=1 Tax=Xyrauchen texanus TaxID=154827 RepID=UPI0022424A50|nr:chemokine (C-X-C motif) ligand 18a, duplicate 1 [Xyrauchen texanus]
MYFRTLQASVSLLLMLLVCSNIITDKRTAAITIREKCQCIEETGSVQWRKITNYTIIENDPLCNKVQIILWLSSKQACLNPDSKQGKRLQSCWKRIKSKTQHKKVCLKLQRKKGPKKQKKH